jgi:serine/threonine protein kinase/tetratricopeptide (TPR) repeat protein
MDPKRWKEIDRLCRLVLEVEPAERVSFLEKACAGDEPLRREIESLLAHQEEAQGFLDASAMEIAAKALAKNQICELRSDYTGRTLRHYRVLEKIGEGGMGLVYRAWDEHLQRNVAIKVLPSGTLADESARKRFRKEALALSRLNHPNLEAVYDFDAQDGIDFLVMEYVPGVTIGQKIEQGPLDEKMVIDLGLQIAAALEEAHEKGVVHRDLKPANIVLTPKGQAKILDFGLARLLQPAGNGIPAESLGETHAIAGTLPYMAPEQLRGEKADARTDIHAFGAVLYEMCSGNRVYAEDAISKLTDAILHQPPLPLHAVNPGISPRLEVIILKCLEKNRESRYQSARDLLADLRLETPVPAPPVHDFGRPRKPLRLVLAAGVSLAALIIAISVWMGNQKPSLAFSNQDWILIADFENFTGEELFDTSLDTALRVSIEQSSYINVLPKRRITETLRRMKRESTQRVNATIGREIAEREGIKALLVPSISGVAGTYVLSASVEDPKTGASFRSEITRARTKQDVLGELDRLAGLIRKDLGESWGAIASQSKPLTKVTTSSLEALKQYSLGIDNQRRGNFAEARAFYESALALDPDFVSAKASLGMLHFESARIMETQGTVRFQGINSNLGKKLLAEAIKAENLTDRERYNIRIFYADAVQGDLPKSVEYLKAALALYPNDSYLHNSLGWRYRLLRRFDDSISEYGEAIRIDPGLMLSYDGLSGLYIYDLGRVSDGVALTKKQLAVDSGHWQAYANLGWGCLGTGDLECARAAFERACSLDPNTTQELFRLAHTYRLQKNYAKAIETLKRILTVNPTASIDYDLGVNYQCLNDQKQARRHFEFYRLKAEKDLRAHPKDFAYQIVLAIVRARLGMGDQLPAADRRGIQLGEGEHFLLAHLYAVRGKADPAVQELELALEKGFRQYIFMKIHPDLENLGSNPQFQALLRRVLK